MEFGLVGIVLYGVGMFMLGLIAGVLYARDKDDGNEGLFEPPAVFPEPPPPVVKTKSAKRVEGGKKAAATRKAKQAGVQTVNGQDITGAIGQSVNETDPSLWNHRDTGYGGI